jgi:DNA-binding winged helix-turn-helix (wHTH) protein/cytochrome c-type biogenesis protein CcmH/NrfG
MRRFLLGDWIVESSARTLRRGDQLRRLSPKAMRVLQALAEADGDVVARDELMDAAWPELEVCDDVLTHAIAELRGALGAGVIRTVYGTGYRLEQPIRREAAAVSASGVGLTAYLRAQSKAEDGGKANSEEATRLYREAIAFDPRFAPAMAGLATTLIKVSHYYGGGPALLREAASWAEKAVATESFSADAQAAMGAALAGLGKFDRALSRFATAIRLQPDASEAYRLLARVYFVNGAHESSVAACERAARLRSEEYQCLIMGAKALRALGDTAKANAWMRWARVRIEQRLAEEPDNMRALCNLICCLVEAGEHEKALPLLKRVRAEHDGMAYYVVGALARAGHNDLALDQLEEVTECGWAHGAYLAHDPDLDGLRREHRFRRVAARLNAR